ncbi:hypothetical protein HJG60_010159 [Phyllostomus discolor]|uniref:Uncharacterized protein n=1 Tax=Phyllostomus discolor TaxID=89673 RepID=A0A834EK21_9CHIR|nr:hypothetical protein HJG60_010159 [Phyllostomus discolor]
MLQSSISQCWDTGLHAVPCFTIATSLALLVATRGQGLPAAACAPKVLRTRDALCAQSHRSLCHKPSLPGCLTLPFLPVWMNTSTFNSLVVQLPYSSIFCQFWLLFILFLNYCCPYLGCARRHSVFVYLRHHLGQKSRIFTF